MLRTITFAVLSLMLVTAIIYRPSEAFQASLQGLTVWWNIVFPGLLPFLTLLELMLAFGAVHALGTLLHPLMRRLFRLPGQAGFAMALGWTGGFPAGAESAAALRKSGLLTRGEGQRLLAMAHMPNPLFIIIVVGSGFLKRPELGIAIAGTVWLAGLAASFVMARFTREQAPIADEQQHTGILRRAAAAMADARNQDGRSFGKTLGDAVTVSVAKLMAIGGFMMMCAVIAGLIETLLPNALPAPLLTGLLESHIGAFSAATAQIPGGLPWNLAAITAILSWGGLSSLLQAGSALGGTDLSVWRLAVHRLLQAVLAFLLSLTVTSLIVKYVLGDAADSSPVMLQNGTHWKGTGPLRVSDLPDIWPYMPAALLTFAGILTLLCLISAGSARLARPNGR